MTTLACHDRGMTTRIRITVDGKLALTTAQAAQRHGIASTATMRKRLQLAGVEPVDHLDARTPLYSAAEVGQLMKARPLRGSAAKG